MTSYIFLRLICEIADLNFTKTEVDNMTINTILLMRKTDKNMCCDFPYFKTCLKHWFYDLES